jgi:pimeloyl-ACP methyl ester carboxylesterase
MPTVRAGFLVLVLAVALLAPAAGLARAAQPAGPATPPGTPRDARGDFAGMVDIGGRSLYLTCWGEGSPTVIMESGTPMTADAWNPYQTKIAEFTHVCAYDRANVGRSEAAPTPRTAQQMVDDLHALLAAAGVPPPYVLHSYSFGPLVTRLYASQYPAEVAGLVLVDALPEDFFDRARPLLSEEQWANRIATAWAGNPEQIDLDASFAQVRAAGPLPEVPLVVLTHGDPRADPYWLPADWPIEQLEPIWQQMQSDLARSVPNGRLIVAEGIGHGGFGPDLVAGVIRDVVAAARDPGGWATPTAATPAP